MDKGDLKKSLQKADGSISKLELLERLTAPSDEDITRYRKMSEKEIEAELRELGVDAEAADAAWERFRNLVADMTSDKGGPNNNPV